MVNELAIPQLPASRWPDTLDLYQQLGFSAVFRQDNAPQYAVLRRGELELHLYGLSWLDPAASYAGCYLRVRDVDGLHSQWARIGLPSNGIPRLGPIRDQPWGMREFHLVDPSGNVLRVGWPISDEAAE